MMFSRLARLVPTSSVKGVHFAHILTRICCCFLMNVILPEER